MDESSYLNPSTMREQCDIAISNLQKDTESLIVMETGLDSFVTNDEIKSDAFDSLKQQLNDYKTIIAAMKRANDADIYDFTRLKTVVGNEVLDGSIILAQQKEALDSYYRNESSASTYETKAMNTIEPWVGSFYWEAARNYRLLAAIDYQIYQRWKKKEEKYDQIESDTCGMFLESCDVRATAHSAIRSLTKVYKDGVYNTNMEAPWRVNLAQEVFDLNYQDSGEDASWGEIFLDIFAQGRKGYANVSGDVLQLMLSPTMIGLIGAVTKQVAEGKSTEEAIKSVFGYYIPHFVEDDTLLLVLEAMALCNKMPDEKIAEHLKHNEEAWKDKSGEYGIESYDGYWYIEHQNMMDEIFFGNLTANSDSCGAIATYNTFVNLNGGTSPVSFPEVLSAYEKYGIVANGELGMSATAINNYFMLNGYQTEFLSGNEITDKSLAKMDEEYNAYVIMTYNNGDDINSYVHFMSITKEIDLDNQMKYCLHNDYSKKEGNDEAGITRYDSINDIIDGYNQGIGEYICVIGVNK